MKTLTKKQRGEIYLKVAESLSNKLGFICNELKFTFYIPQARILDLFPELALFIPDCENPWFNSESNKDYLTTSHCSNKEAMRRRIICLLLCYEMTK